MLPVILSFVLNVMFQVLKAYHVVTQLLGF